VLNLHRFGSFLCAVSNTDGVIPRLHIEETDRSAEIPVVVRDLLLTSLRFAVDYSPHERHVSPVLIR